MGKQLAAGRRTPRRLLGGQSGGPSPRKSPGLPAGGQQASAYFEAFDAPSKPAAAPNPLGRFTRAEAHWGLYDVNAAPKPALLALPPTLH
jgi:hypothetical protein